MAWVVCWATQYQAWVSGIVLKVLGLCFFGCYIPCCLSFQLKLLTLRSILEYSRYQEYVRYQEYHANDSYDANDAREKF